MIDGFTVKNGAQCLVRRLKRDHSFRMGSKDRELIVNSSFARDNLQVYRIEVDGGRGMGQMNAKSMLFCRSAQVDDREIQAF